MQWQEVIETLGGISIFSIVLGFLGKKAIESYIQGRVESLKSNLERIASEHSIKFQNLHAARAEIIKGCYEKLTSLDDALHSTLRPFQGAGEPELEEKVEKLTIQFNEFREYFLPHRIYFEKDTCKLVDAILTSAKGVFFDITTFPVSIKDYQYEYNRDLLKERHEFWEKARSIHNNEISNLKEELEDEFRKLLGIDA